MMRTTSIPVRPHMTERLDKFLVFRQGSNKGYEIACTECQPNREAHDRWVTTFKRTWPLATEYMDTHKETHQEASEDAAAKEMTTEEYENEHRKIDLEHQAMINDALRYYGDNRAYKVERADRWLENAVNQLDKSYIGF